jgi:hypothetical protein
MAERNRTVQLARSTVECPCHACAFFHTKEEEYQIILPFVKDGLHTGDKNYQFVDKGRRAERLASLKESGIDTAAAEQDGLLEVLSWEEVYLRDGRFDQRAMLTMLEDLFSGSKQQGFGMTRLWANMEWALEDFPGVHDIVEYESRLNDILPKYNQVTVCTYDVTRFSASVMMDILRTHPQVIIGGILRENPYYVSPDEFLSEVRGRGASAH